MTGGKVSRALVAMLGLILLAPPVLATNRLFIVDTSKSMQQNGLFSRIVASLKNDYVAKMEPGEHLLLLTFDENVSVHIDQQFNTPEDLKQINARIDDLKAKGLHTWMSEALRLAAQQVERLRLQYPDTALNIYLLTDGVNDPPPRAAETPAAFPELIAKYFKGMRIDKESVYLVLYQQPQNETLSPADRQRVEETSTQVKLIPNTPEMPAVLPEVQLEFTEFNGREINLSSGPVVRTGQIVFSRVNTGAAGKRILLALTAHSYPAASLPPPQPAELTVTAEGEQAAVTIQIPADLPNGPQEMTMAFSGEGIIVSPQAYPLSLNIIRDSPPPVPEPAPPIPTPPVPPEPPLPPSPTHVSLWTVVGLLFLASLLVYILLRLFRWRQVCLKCQDDESLHVVVVHGIRRSPLSKIDLPNCHLVLGASPKELFTILLFENDKRLRRITPGVSVTCHKPNGQEVMIEFVPCDSVQAVTVSPAEGGEHDIATDPDFFVSKRDSP